MARITGLRLSAVHVNDWVDWVFVHVECTGGGVGGLGELNAGGLHTGPFCGKALACLALIEAGLMGQDPCDVVALTAPLLARARAPPAEAGSNPADRWKVWLCAVSAVEQALWDCLGQSCGLPVYKLLGGAHSSTSGGERPASYGLRLYANINRISRRMEERTPSNFAANAVAAVGAGHSAVKLGPFDAGHHAASAAAAAAEPEAVGGGDNGSGAGGLANWESYVGGKMNDISAPEAARGIACVKAVREAVGPDVAVLVDVHSRFTLRGETFMCLMGIHD
jgi:galactonate dehydratase